MNRTRGTLVGVVLLLLAATSAWAQATAQINGNIAEATYARKNIASIQAVLSATDGH